MSQRTERIDELLREEIGRIIDREIADPRVGFATVTDVETSPDLQHARVWVSVIGGEVERKETIAALERAMGYIRRELGTRLRLRRIPELHVRLDESAERGTRVLRILADLEAGREPPELPDGETLPTPAPRRSREDAPPEEGGAASGAETEAGPGGRPTGRRRARPAASRTVG
ncbi:MAG TPA: 30S ribosome-binding factor RbfA, partial [Candidatus Limnocylindrales bacterium]|nr:30S ribosome-binding factor RbfA [Candidatus Limnocylindrales bacterium]